MAVAGSLTYSTKIDTSGYQKGINDIKGTTQSAMGQIKNIVAALGIDKLISSAMNTINSSIDSAMNRIDTMNQFTRVMTAMTGSAEKADEALNSINETVTGTAYGLDVAARSTQKFVTSGMDLDKATNQIKTWADAVAFYGDGTNATFENVTDALAKMVSKGKVEMEQLNRLTDAGIPAVQIYADAVGRSVSEVQDDLSDGVISTQEFMDGLSDAFNNGTTRFASITDAAKQAGASWSATFDNMRAAVTRGMVSIIKSIDSGLKDAGLPEMRELISSVGKEAEKVMKNVAQKLPGVLKNVVKFLNQNADALVSVVKGLVAFKGALLIQSAVNGLVKSVKNLNKAFMANPWGIAIAGATALLTLLYSLAERSDAYAQKLKKETEAVNSARDAQEELNKQTQQTVSQGMSELSYYENLFLQLRNLVDENGRVKQGYEDRVNFITGQLANGLGMEINLVDGVIQNYSELSSTFDEVIEKKRAMVTLNAQEEQYTEAIKQQGDAYKKLTEYSNDLADAREKLNRTQEKFNELEEKRKSGIGFTSKEAQDYNVYKKELEDLTDYVDGQEKLYNKQKKIVEEYTTDIAVYEDNFQKFQEGHYDEMTQYSKNYLSDLELNSNDQVKALQDQIDQEKEKLEFLRDLKKQSNTDIYDDQIEASEQRLAQLQGEFEKEKNIVATGNQQTLEAWLLGLQNTVNQLTGRQIEFKDLGNGFVQTFIDGVEQGEPIAYSNMKEFGDNLVKELDKKSNAKKSAESILDGVIEGINNSSKWSIIFGSVNSLSNKIVDAFNKSLDINSPSGVFEYWSKFIPDGVAVGIEKNTKKAVDAIDYMNKEMVDKVKNSVALETGNINADLKAKSSLNNNNTIQINATFTGEVDMDGDRVGRIITPAISKTLKAGGLK